MIINLKRSNNVVTDLIYTVYKCKWNKNPIQPSYLAFYLDAIIAIGSCVLSQLTFINYNASAVILESTADTKDVSNYNIAWAIYCNS